MKIVLTSWTPSPSPLSEHWALLPCPLTKAWCALYPEGGAQGFPDLFLSLSSLLHPPSPPRTKGATTGDPNSLTLELKVLSFWTIPSLVFIQLLYDSHIYIRFQIQSISFIVPITKDPVFFLGVPPTWGVQMGLSVPGQRRGLELNKTTGATALCRMESLSKTGPALCDRGCSLDAASSPSRPTPSTPCPSPLLPLELGGLRTQSFIYTPIDLQTTGWVPERAGLEELPDLPHAGPTPGPDPLPSLCFSASGPHLGWVSLSFRHPWWGLRGHLRPTQRLHRRLLALPPLPVTFFLPFS